MSLRNIVATSLWFLLLWAHPIRAAPAGVSDSLDDPESTTTQAPAATAPRGYVYPRLICPICYRIPQSVEGLKRHLVQSHSADPDVINTAPGLYERGSYIYRCTECSRAVQSRRQFADHFDEPPHVPSGRFTCPHCGVVHESVNRHREHLVFSHLEPRLWRGRPNNAAKGEADVHRPRPPVPFLPLINLQQVMSGISSRSNGAIVKKTLSVKQCKRLPGKGQNEASPASGSHQPCPPSGSLAVEAWPSVNAGNVRRVAECTPRNVGGDSNAVNRAVAGPPAPAGTHVAGSSTGILSGDREEPLWFRTYSHEGVPFPHRFASLSADRLGDDDIAEAIPQVGIFARPGPSALESLPAAEHHRPLRPPIPPRTYPRRPLWFRSGLRSRGGSLPVRDRSPINREPEVTAHIPANTLPVDHSHQDREEFYVVEVDPQSRDFRQVICPPVETNAVSDGPEDTMVIEPSNVFVRCFEDASQEGAGSSSSREDGLGGASPMPSNGPPDSPFEVLPTHSLLSSTSGFPIDDNEAVRSLLSPQEEEQDQGVSAQAASTSSTPTFVDRGIVPLPASSTTSHPGESPESLPGGLPALGGLVCVWATASNGSPRQRRS